MIDLTLDDVNRCQEVLAGELCNTPIRWNERLKQYVHCPNGQEQGGGWQHQAVPPTKEEP